VKVSLFTLNTRQIFTSFAPSTTNPTETMVGTRGNPRHSSGAFEVGLPVSGKPAPAPNPRQNKPSEVAADGPASETTEAAKAESDQAATPTAPVATTTTAAAGEEQAAATSQAPAPAPASDPAATVPVPETATTLHAKLVQGYLTYSERNRKMNGSHKIFESGDSEKRYSGHTGIMTVKYFYTPKKQS
jgi:hypothetical protein